MNYRIVLKNTPRKPLLSERLIPLGIIALVIIFTFLLPFLVREVGMQAVGAAIIGFAHIFAIPLTHQFATHGASPATPIRIPPIVNELLRHHIPTRALIPFVDIERGKPIQLLLIE